MRRVRGTLLLYTPSPEKPYNGEGGIYRKNRFTMERNDLDDRIARFGIIQSQEKKIFDV